jgi:hypothetical protein
MSKEIDSQGFECLDSFSQAANLAALNVLADGPVGARQDELMTRLDGAGDRAGHAWIEMGRVHRASSRAGRAANLDVSALVTADSKVLIDGRSLQDPNYMFRGVGLFASALVEAALGITRHVEFLIDPRLGSGRLPVSAILRTPRDLQKLEHAFDAFLEPSPMTHDMGPLAGRWDLLGTRCAIVYDFIPARRPDIYLADPILEAEYRSRLALLESFDRYWCISRWTEAQLRYLFGTDVSSAVVWPSGLVPTSAANAESNGRGRGDSILISSGNEWRKNWSRAIQGIISNRDLDSYFIDLLGVPRDVVMADHAIASLGDALARVRCHTDLTYEQVESLYATATVTVVPSLDEGLSLPVIESIAQGTPVAPSGIPAHLELAGTSRACFDPLDKSAIGAAVQYAVEHAATVSQSQQTALHQHSHVDFQIALKAPGRRDLESGGERSVSRVSRVAHGRRRRRGSIAVVSPFPPCMSGVADFTGAMVKAMSEIAPVDVAGPGAESFSPGALSIAQVIDSAASYDAVISVVGNSHFHMDSCLVLEQVGGVALCHDVRLTEFNLALYGMNRAIQIANTPPAKYLVTHEDVVSGLQNADDTKNLGFGLVGASADRMIFHSEATAKRVADEVGHPNVRALPFPVYRAPGLFVDPARARRSIRQELGLKPSVKIVAMFGGVDVRTKAADTFISAVAYLQMWGYDVLPVLIGDVAPGERSELEAIQGHAGIPRLIFTGPVSQERYRDWLYGVDAGAVLRNGSLLSLSGAALDLLSHGVPCVLSQSVARDCGSTSFVREVEDYFTGLLVAEALEAALDLDRESQSIEEARRTFVDGRSLRQYVRGLLGVSVEGSA